MSGIPVIKWYIEFIFFNKMVYRKEKEKRNKMLYVTIRV
jgi:hypothetical protein